MTADRACAEVGADQHDVAEALVDQVDAPQDEGAHQDLAELGVRLHQRKQRITAELHRFARLGDLGAYQRAAPRQQGDLAGELARPERMDQRVALDGRPDDVDPTLQHHEECGVGRAGLEQPLALRNRAHPAVPPRAPDLRGRERRKHLLDAGMGCQAANVSAMGPDARQACRIAASP